MTNTQLKTERTRCRRLPARGHYDRDTVYAILDAAMVCHIGFAFDGQPFVIPTIYVRTDDRLYVHGAVTSRMLTQLRNGAPVCVTVTHIDGLVLARSAFHHSMNYRSAVVLGTAVEVDDPDEKSTALLALVEHVMAGRSAEVRPPSAKELRATSVLRIPIEEASAKMRVGPPVDDAEDYAMGCWAGVIPMAPGYGAPEPDPRLAPGIDLPDYVRERYQRTRSMRGS